MTDETAQRTSKRRGDLWSFLRSVLSQGGDIWIDHQQKSYEEYSARLDAAARERVERLAELLRTPDETTEQSTPPSEGRCSIHGPYVILTPDGNYCPLCSSQCC